MRLEWKIEDVVTDGKFERHLVITLYQDDDQGSIYLSSIRIPLQELLEAMLLQPNKEEH